MAALCFQLEKTAEHKSQDVAVGIVNRLEEEFRNVQQVFTSELRPVEIV
jgi:hypothetical protein